MSDAPVVNIDLPSFWDDPYPVLASMRADTPICFVPQLNAVLLTRRDDIHRCEKNVSVFSSDQPGGLMNVLMGKNMMRKDGDEHRRERFVYYPAISPTKVVSVWADKFNRITDTVLDQLVDDGSGDLVASYATVVSGEALKEMTGLVNVGYGDIDHWSQSMIDGVANYGGDAGVEAKCLAATAAIDEAIDERLSYVRQHPDYSLLSVMVEAGMPLDDVRANIKLTISGGQNEPRDAIAGAVWALLSHPRQLEMAMSGAVRWLDVFEEYCRWVAPIGMSPRRIATDHQFGGVTFETDERVFLMFGSANRDEDHFDKPDQFDISRDNSPSLSFGAGPHFCAGAAASRSLVGDIALPKVFERLKDLALDYSSAPVKFGGWAFRGPLSLPATWSSN